MSADNWAVCPRCLRQRDARYAAQQEQLAALYGKVPLKEFEAKKLELDRIPTLDDTLREDYELGMHPTGVFTVAYKAYCTACRWSYEFKHENPNAGASGISQP